MSTSTRAPLTTTLAEWATSLRYEDLPAGVVHQAKRAVLDYAAATLVGSTSGPARIVQDYLAEVEGPGPATVVGTPLRLSAANAALANGTAAHGLEVDDGYTRGGYHPGGPTLSAVLAIAEATGSGAHDILLATVVGYELSCRLAGAGHPATWHRGFHNTPVVGVFGAAAGVAKLLEGRTEHPAGLAASALGLAGSHAGGLFEFLGHGAEVKRLHAGKAGRDGLVSAELAARGLTGPATVLEGPHGYLHAFAGDEFDEQHLLAGLGTEWRTLQTYIKPYPCCRHLHGPIDAILALSERAPIDVDALESITVETFTSAARHGGTSIGDFLDAQMSIPYAVAVTLLHGVPSLEHFEADARRDPRVRRLIDLVEVREAPDCSRDFPAMRPARVVLRGDGEQRQLRVDQPYGEPGNPVADVDLEAKLHRLAGPVVGPDRCKRITSEIWSFDAPEQLFAELRTSD
ncbi:MAG: MmgE/PrpD family protein [Pseudonocardiaceae bacterium]|nr:MmgE/PrpD family protein [Pseudonocardiaceae bacterium]